MSIMLNFSILFLLYFQALILVMDPPRDLCKFFCTLFEPYDAALLVGHKTFFFGFIDLLDQTKGYVASPKHTDSLLQLYCRSSSISTAKMNLCRKN